MLFPSNSSDVLSHAYLFQLTEYFILITQINVELTMKVILTWLCATAAEVEATLGLTPSFLFGGSVGPCKEHTKVDLRLQKYPVSTYCSDGAWIFI